MEALGDDKHPRLDVYAQPFIPQVWKDINLAPANIIPCAPAPWINFDSFVQRFSGTDFLNANPSPVQARASSNGANGSIPEGSQPRSPSNGVNTPSFAIDSADAPLACENYLNFFTDALKQEAAALNQECEDHALYNVPLYKASGYGHADPRPSMYRFVNQLSIYQRFMS